MYRRFFGLLALVLVLFVLGYRSTSADDGALEPLNPPPPAEDGEMVDESFSLWFVEMASAPTADGTKQSTVKAEKAAFRSNAKKAGLVYTERHAFDTLWNGLSIEIGASQLSKLARIPGVNAIYPVEIVQVPETAPMSDPELATALAMTGADVAQSELGYTGSGVKVAIMDTGVDYHHPDLGGCFGASCRVVTGWDFVGDLFNADPSSLSYNPNPVPDPDPDDCQGHGTHVAGIVGASAASSSGVTGVAPGVTFGAYRVFGCTGSTTADIMIAAMERALQDGMHVLNMSIGSAFQWPQYPTAQASDRLVNKGMVVVASIGNSGAAGLYSAGAPGLGQKVIGVASFDNTHVSLSQFTVTPANITAGYGNAAAAPAAPTSGSLPMDRSGTTTSPADACNVGGVSPFSPGQFAGKAVLIRRGACTFFEKSFNAQNAGAAAVVLYNSVAGRFSPTVAGAVPIVIPVVAISDAEGAAINAAIASGPQTLNWTDQTGSFLNPTGGLISSFSSYGLSPDLALKPDIGAPGGLIRSTYPLEQGSYVTLSGTSMSSPHVAGGVALLLEARPNTPSQAVRGILQNSADPMVWWGIPSLGLLDNVHRQGAGMLDIDDAILAKTKIEPGKLSLGESQAGPSTQTLKIENKGSSTVTYDLSMVNAVSTGANTSTPSFFLGGASASFSSASVTVPAGGAATVDVTITAPATPANGQYGGYIVFTPQGGGPVYRVPFAGYIGDYQARQVLTGPFPFLSRLVSCTPPDLLRGNDCFGSGLYTVFPSGTVYSMVDAFNIPFFLVHFDHQAAKFRVELFAAGTNKAWHRAYDEVFMRRSTSSSSFSAFSFDGTTFAGNKTYTLPNGDYYAVISVLKANGDDSNPAHWESWTSPTFTIQRP